MKNSEFIKVLSSINNDDNYLDFRVTILGGPDTGATEIVHCYIAETTEFNGNIFVTFKPIFSDDAYRYVTPQRVLDLFNEFGKDTTIIFEYEIERFKTRKLEYYGFVTDKNNVILLFNE